MCAILFASFTVTLHATKHATKTKKVIFDKEGLDKLLKEIKIKIIKNKKNKPHISTEYTGYATRLEAIIKHPNLEKKTNIRKRWYKKIIVTFKNMAKIKLNMKVAVLNKNRKEYKKTKLQYETQIKNLIYLYKNPDKIKKKKSKKSF